MQCNVTIISNRSIFMALCVIGICAPYTWAQGQPVQPATNGFSVGGHMTLGSWDVDEEGVSQPLIDTEHANGIGGGILIAYGITEWLTIYVNGDGRESNGHVFAHGDLGVQVLFRSGHRLRPHLGLAATGRRSEFDMGTETIDGRGAGWSFGGGVLYFVSPSFALDAALLRSVGNLDQFRDGVRAKDLDAFDVSSTRVNIGIRWYPGR